MVCVCLSSSITLTFSLRSEIVFYIVYWIHVKCSMNICWNNELTDMIPQLPDSTYSWGIETQAYVSQGHQVHYCGGRKVNKECLPMLCTLLAPPEKVTVSLNTVFVHDFPSVSIKNVFFHDSGCSQCDVSLATTS